MKQIFEEMYQKKIWGGGSGVGSLPEATVRYRAVLQKLLTDYQVRSVVDIGCGDWQTGSLVDWTGIEYTGIDIVPEVIEADRNPRPPWPALPLRKRVGDVAAGGGPADHQGRSAAFGAGGRIPLPAADGPVPAGPRDDDIEDPDPHKEILWTEHWRPLDLTKPPFNRNGEVLLVDDPPPGPPKPRCSSATRMPLQPGCEGPKRCLCRRASPPRRRRHEETLVDVVAEATRGELACGPSPRTIAQRGTEFRIVPPIEVIDDVDFREAKRESLNRLCNIVDWQAWGPLSTVMNQLADSVTIHRKSWEYAMCIHGLDKLGVVTPASTALAVGADTRDHSSIRKLHRAHGGHGSVCTTPGMKGSRRCLPIRNGLPRSLTARKRPRCCGCRVTPWTSRTTRSISSSALLDRALRESRRAVQELAGDAAGRQAARRDCDRNRTYSQRCNAP